MARVNEFNVPQDFKPMARWVPPDQRGKLEPTMSNVRGVLEQFEQEQQQRKAEALARVRADIAAAKVDIAAGDAVPPDTVVEFPSTAARRSA
ncbi:MAG: hypothetical protein L0338_20895 [Acidobacteria bacterium]|nr:hypothetical protein [Acidobacteriota bacterium]